MKKLSILSVSIVFYLTQVTIASAVTFSDLYVFGDSLSDSGQFGVRATNEVDPLDPTSEKAMVWSQYFSEQLGLGELLPSTPLLGGLSGNNYAIVTNRSNEILSSITDPDGSVVGPATRDGYLIEFSRAKPNALYVVWGGGNDLRDIRDARAQGGSQATLRTNARLAADNIVSGVVALSRAGARYILVPNLPDIGRIPESNILGSGYVSAGNDATQAFNDRLLGSLNATGANIIQADVQTLFREILSDPSLYGFSTENHQLVAYDGTAFTGIPAVEGTNGANTASPDPSLYVFFDGIHPTTDQASILAQYYQSILAAPGQISILAEIPLSLSQGHLDALENHLRLCLTDLKKGEFFSFVSGSRNLVDVDDTDEAPGYDNRDYSLTAGLSYCFTHNWIGGISLGHHSSSVDIDDDGGGVDLDGLFISLLSGGRSNKLSFNAIATVADLDYEVITRKVRLGRALRKHEGETSGDYYAFKMSLTYDILKTNGFTLGPVSSVNYQNIDVDDYQEKGSMSTSMNFHDQDRRSLLGSIGAFADYNTRTPVGPLQAHTRIAYEKEFKDDPRDVRAGLNTLQGSSFELPGYQPEEDSWIFDLGLGTEFVRGWITTVSYHLHKGETDSISQGIQISLQTRF